MVAKGRKAQGERTRKAILETAVHIASAEGLEGLTIGRLALELSMSKSGLFAHFGSKEELQVATVEAARAIFIHEVIKPAFESTQGLLRLWKMCDIWLSYVQSGVFRGGCFFAAAAAEFDSRPGAVRDRIAEIMKEWLSTLRSAIVEAQSGAGLLSWYWLPHFPMLVLFFGVAAALSCGGLRKNVGRAIDLFRRAFPGDEQIQRAKK